MKTSSWNKKCVTELIKTFIVNNNINIFFISMQYTFDVIPKSFQIIRYALKLRTEVPSLIRLEKHFYINERASAIKTKIHKIAHRQKQKEISTTIEIHATISMRLSNVQRRPKKLT